MTDANASQRSRPISSTYGIDLGNVGNITWDTMRSKVSLPSTPVNAIRWIMPDGTKIGTHDDDQHITLAGDDPRRPPKLPHLWPPQNPPPEMS
jgi:hypothetical protein